MAVKKKKATKRATVKSPIKELVKSKGYTLPHGYEAKKAKKKRK